jgi:homogentisate 1,2-dioxygenase
VEASLEATYTAELAVMCDTFRPLFPTKAALELDDPKYVESWQGEHFPRLASGELKLNGEASRGDGQMAKGKSADTWAP